MLRIAVIVMLATQSVVRGCDEGWDEYGQQCVSVSPEPLDWFAAAAACNLYGANLVQIRDANKQNFVLTQLKARGIEDAWLGGSRRYHESSWLWIPSLEPIKGYTKWAKNQPDNWKGENENGEQCLHMWEESWNDLSCRVEHHFVCEKKAVT